MCCVRWVGDLSELSKHTDYWSAADRKIVRELQHLVKPQFAGLSHSSDCVIPTSMYARPLLSQLTHHCPITAHKLSPPSHSLATRAETIQWQLEVREALQSKEKADDDSAVGFAAWRMRSLNFTCSLAGRSRDRVWEMKRRIPYSAIVKRETSLAFSACCSTRAHRDLVDLSNRKFKDMQKEQTNPRITKPRSE